jgi:acyl-coenzyme A thioesterase PaaI-like protein
VASDDSNRATDSTPSGGGRRRGRDALPAPAPAAGRDLAGTDPFHRRGPLGWDGGPGFGPFIEAMRDLQDVVGGTNPPADAIARATAQLRELADELRPWTCTERELIAGRRHDLPGRGHPLLLPFIIEEQTDRSVRGRVRFSQYHLGGNGAAHGGTLPLMFDEVLGNLSNAADRPIARTAYLLVNYRRVTPIDTDLHVIATIDREEGRKRFLSGRLFHGDTLVADAEGLFVALLVGQP